MANWDTVVELKPEERAFQVFHRRLKISRNDYVHASSFPQPFCEEGYQDFVARYLAAKDDKGIVGMVRLVEKDDYLILDAAVRYPIDSDQQQSEIRLFETNS